MNLVKGVADLIRRTSAGQSGDFGSGSPSERFNPPSPTIRFSEVGDEAILNTLWERYENSFDKVCSSYEAVEKNFEVLLL